jgi:ABC-type lipoprotein export system ATPase subunit
MPDSSTLDQSQELTTFQWLKELFWLHWSYAKSEISNTPGKFFKFLTISLMEAACLTAFGMSVAHIIEYCLTTSSIVLSNLYIHIGIIAGTFMLFSFLSRWRENSVVEHAERLAEEKLAFLEQRDKEQSILVKVGLEEGHEKVPMLRNYKKNYKALYIKFYNNILSNLTEFLVFNLSSVIIAWMTGGSIFSALTIGTVITILSNAITYACYAKLASLKNDLAQIEKRASEIEKQLQSLDASYTKMAKEYMHIQAQDLISEQKFDLEVKLQNEKQAIESKRFRVKITTSVINIVEIASRIITTIFSILKSKYNNGFYALASVFKNRLVGVLISKNDIPVEVNADMYAVSTTVKVTEGKFERKYQSGTVYYDEKESSIKLQGLSMLQCNNSNKIHITNNINHTFEPGTITLLYGPSGCGKSTLISAIAGTHHLYEGSISFPAVYRDARKIFHIPKIDLKGELGANLGKTLREYMMHGISQDKIKAVETELVILFGRLSLDTAILDKPINASSGESFRILLIKAILSRADLILCDEGLDTVSSDILEQCITLLKDYTEGRYQVDGIGKHRIAIFITHHIEEAHIEGAKIMKMDKFKPTPSSTVSTASHSDKRPITTPCLI